MDENFTWREHYDEGVPFQIEYPDQPLHTFLEDVARQHPQKTCTVFKGARLTYREVDEAADRLAAGLAGLGVVKGSRVGIFMPNTPQFVIAYFAALKLGGIVVATSPLYSEKEIEHQANDAGIEVMLVMSNFYRIVKQVQPKTSIRTLVVTNIKEALPPMTSFLFTMLREKKDGFRVELEPGDVWMQDLIQAHQPSDRPTVTVTAEDRALFQYSGGTTGVPKAAVALHRNLVANTLQIYSWMPTLEYGSEVFMVAIPLFHVYGMVVGMNFGIATAGTLVLVPNPRDLEDLLKHIQKYKASIFPGVPTLYNAINNHPDVKSGKYDLQSIKACVSGSAPLLSKTKEVFESLTGGVVFEGYGLSEAPTATHCNPYLGVNKEGSIGMPLPDVEVRVVSLEDGRTVLPADEIGEMVIRGPQVMFGYHNMPTETANTLRDGWLYTGDIVRMDDEGYFYIVDRKKELIKPGGFQVWPREVEEVIQAHPKVREVGVAGVPDPYRGETVKAWVVLQDGERSSEEEIRGYCKENMAKYKVPTAVEFIDELPKSSVGKILRRELVRIHQDKVEAEKPV
jgi:long-chain acyl-CoA synthetase